MPTRRVLVVDDEEDILESTCMVLRSMGYEPIPLSDAGDVLPQARHHQPGLILQDLRMPRLNVAGIVAALRSDPETADIPIVFFSANADIAATAKRYDVWGFLRKPFTAAELQEVVERAFGGPRPVAGDIRKTIRDVFHEQWNVMASVSNYAHILRDHGDADGQQVAKNLQGQLLRLEASIDRLHSFVSALADRAAEIPAPPEVRPPRPPHRHTPRDTQDAPRDAVI